MGAQAEELTSLVAYFKLSKDDVASRTVEVESFQASDASQISAPRAHPPVAVAAKPKPSLPPGATVDDSDWQEF